MEHYTALIKECHEGSREPPPEVADSETEYYETSVARVSGSQALQLLHHYLQKITVDRFTRLTIAWTVKVGLSCCEKKYVNSSFFRVLQNQTMSRYGEASASLSPPPRKVTWPQSSFLTRLPSTTRSRAR